MSKHLIFVYGTLKRGWGNNAIIKDQVYIGDGVTNPCFQMYTLGGYPGVVPGNESIKGELWSVDEQAFARCDRLEGHPDFYKREQVTITLEDGEFCYAWMYIYQRDVSNYKPIDRWTR